MAKILTEEELSTLSPDILAKLEAAYTAKMNSAIRDEQRKTSAKFETLMQVVGKKFDEKIDRAVDAGMNKMSTDAINGKLCEALTKITGIVESLGIPATEETKHLRQELDKVNAKMQDDYVERQKILKELNYQSKLARIYELTNGCSADVVNRCIERFKNEDIRAIDKNAIADFIDNNDFGEFGTATIDADIPTVSNGTVMPDIVDKVEMALSEIKDDADMMPGFLSSEGHAVQNQQTKRRKPLGEAANRQFKPERVRIPATGSAMAMNMVDEAQSPDVQAALEQVQAYKELGFGKFI